MCGITGAMWWQADAAIEQATLQRMTDALRHRGPDGEGFYYNTSANRAQGIALGHRRLAIIDLAGGAQPISNEDGTIQVILNGEIYNYQALRGQLQKKGHQFRTHSDTEVIAHLYEEYGPSCVEHLNGMFGLAIWDGPNARLCLARDRLGKKPLWYAQHGQRLIFGSELKSLLVVADLPRTLDPLAVDAFLTLQYIPAPYTIYQGMHKLPPGHYLTVQHGTVDCQRYWEVPGPQEQAPFDARAWPDLLREAVQLRMQSDVPIGAFLSGGIDSSLIVALMQQSTERPVQTFSIGFQEAAYDERPYARQVAHHLQTDHHEFTVEADAVALLPELLEHYDEPFADSSAIPTWYVAREARQAVTVALTGDGGDELFGGYDRYRATGWTGGLDRLPHALRQGVAHAAGNILPRRGVGRKLRRLLEVAALSPGERYLQWVATWNREERRRLYQPDFLRALPAVGLGDAHILETWSQVEGSTGPATAAYVDLCTYLPGDLMTKVDIASMAHGLECRQPFLDYRLVEQAARIPSRSKTNLWRGKLPLRQAFGRLLPESIWHRPKQGFGIPLHAWFRRGPLHDLACQRLLHPSAALHRYLRPSAVQAIWQSHQSGERDQGYRLWSLLILESWLGRWG